MVVASDGSNDDTVKVARQFEDGKRVRVLDYPVNRGKIPLLNATVPQLNGDIVVFSDAPAMLFADSVRKLAANFADPRVGAASGRSTGVTATEGTDGRPEDSARRHRAD